MNQAAAAMFSVMGMLRDRLRPIAHTEHGKLGGGGEDDPLWLRYADLVKLGFSPETSIVVAEAPVALESIQTLLLPDAVAR